MTARVSVTEAEGRAMVMHRALGRCEVGVDPGCVTSQPEWHHRQRRGHARDHRPCNGLAACRPCHSWIHAHPVDAMAKGWIVSTSVPTPAPVAALVRMRGESAPTWCELTPGGTYVEADPPDPPPWKTATPSV